MRAPAPPLTTVAAVAGAFSPHLDRGLAQIASVVAAARQGGAQLVVLPECALGGYLRPGPDGLRAGHALAVDGPEIARLTDLAGPTVVCVGFTEDAPGGPYSSAVCVNGEGVLGHQRKVHVPAGERGAFAPGSGFAAFDTPVGRVGMLVCYDKVFPEAARTLALDGAEIVASLAAWPVCRVTPARRASQDRQTRQFDLLDTARAVENQVVWVSANHTGRLGALRFFGHAKVVDPDGTVLARTGVRPGLALARLDAGAAVRRSRARFSHLGDRVPDAYGAPWRPVPLEPLDLDGLAPGAC